MNEIVVNFLTQQYMIQSILDVCVNNCILTICVCVLFDQLPFNMWMKLDFIWNQKQVDYLQKHYAVLKEEYEKVHTHNKQLYNRRAKKDKEI